MKRLLLSAAIVAMAAPAWGQVQADYETAEHCEPSAAAKAQAAKVGDILVVSCDPSPFRYAEIVVTADRLGYSRNKELTSPASTLTQDEIHNRNQSVIADLLRTVPGLSVSQNGGAGSLTQIRLRGSEANHIVVIIDGVEVANPADGAFDFGGLRTEDVVKIEVLRGEQSALYGSDAVGGVINIITRAGSTQEGWRASVEGGSRGTYEGAVSAVIPLGEAALSVNGNLFTTDGFDISGLGEEKDGSKSRAFSVGLNAIEIGGVNLSTKFRSVIRETDFDSDSDFNGRLNNTFDSTEVKTETARIDARFALAGFDHKIAAHMVETDTETVGGFSSRSIGSRHVANWAAKRDFSDAHSLTILGEAEHEQYEISPNFTEAGAQPDNWTYGIAGDYRFNTNDITFTASARHDINDLFDNATTWRLGAGYGFDWNGRLRASVGTGIKNPTFVELFGFFPASRFTGNRDLQPETSLGVSIGYEQSVGNLDLSLDVFRSELQDEIATVFNLDFSSTVMNLGTDSSREGVELAASWSSDTLSFQGSASFLNSEQNDLEEIRRPKVLASGTATWTPIDELALTVAVDHNGSQLDTDFATFQNVKLDDFTLIGANVRYRLNDRVALTFRGSNLLDKTYEEIVGYTSAGRAVFGGLELDF
ncbi:TonB-dependent receptor [Litorimonas cladophorae]|uniref:TonB-dependent receptor n=1 Tax=Litorimonas cladophorae TaxID=1220491 RepID=A0A918KQR3_9PROT|nr:TonB-dependent receptor [Litorimonas cladophorae]GGX72077.1 TonB-dependent receptor [Litorimonas cladophorae]